MSRSDFIDVLLTRRYEALKHCLYDPFHPLTSKKLQDRLARERVRLQELNYNQLQTLVHDSE